MIVAGQVLVERDLDDQLLHRRLLAPQSNSYSSATFSARIRRRSCADTSSNRRREHLLRVRPRALVVRVVRRPHQGPHAGELARDDTGRVVHERRGDVASEVLARHERQRRIIVRGVPLAGEPVVHALDEVRDPADVVLRRDDPQFGEPLEDAAEDHLRERPLDVRRLRHPLGERLCEVGRLAALGLGEDVHGHGEPERPGHAPTPGRTRRCCRARRSAAGVAPSHRSAPAR